MSTCFEFSRSLTVPSQESYETIAENPLAVLVLQPNCRNIVVRPRDCPGMVKLVFDPLAQGAMLSGTLPSSLRTLYAHFVDDHTLETMPAEIQHLACKFTAQRFDAFTKTHTQLATLVCSVQCRRNPLGALTKSLRRLCQLEGLFLNAWTPPGLVVPEGPLDLSRNTKLRMAVLMFNDEQLKRRPVILPSSVQALTLTSAITEDVVVNAPKIQRLWLSKWYEYLHSDAQRQLWAHATVGILPLAVFDTTQAMYTDIAHLGPDGPPLHLYLYIPSVDAERSYEPSNMSHAVAALQYFTGRVVRVTFLLDAFTREFVKMQCGSMEVLLDDVMRVLGTPPSALHIKHMTNQNRAEYALDILRATIPVTMQQLKYLYR